MKPARDLFDVSLKKRRLIFTGISHVKNHFSCGPISDADFQGGLRTECMWSPPPVAHSPAFVSCAAGSPQETPTFRHSRRPSQPPLWHITYGTVKNRLRPILQFYIYRCITDYLEPVWPYQCSCSWFPGIISQIAADCELQE